MAKDKERDSAEADEKLKDNPIEHLELHDLKTLVKNFYRDGKFKQHDSVTLKELQTGAKLARNYSKHVRDDEANPDDTRDQDGDGNSSDAARNDDDDIRRKSISSSVTSANNLLEPREWKALEIQEKLAFWEEPKDLLITLLACCMASMTQGWDQVATGNLGWPSALGLSVSPVGTGAGVWIFGGANSITWFSAAILGPFLVDPICHSSVFGRRGAVFIAACFSFASMIGCSRATSWQEYFVARLFLGIGIGAKASIVPIWESEILPPAKRGRLLISWQVFTAAGIFAGSIATYIFRNNWRNQVLTGAIPALILLILTFLCCESPRWLVLQGKYVKAFETLVKLRKERIVAAEELCYIYFQIQTERALLRREKIDFGHFQHRIGYSERFQTIFNLPRNYRAAFTSMIVMFSQQLSGINILAFLASVFFSAAGLTSQSSNPADATTNSDNSLCLTIGFGAANTVFSMLAYWLIEPRPDTDVMEEELNRLMMLGEFQDPAAGGAGAGAQPQTRKSKEKNRELPRWLFGRRSLLLLSLGFGTIMLFILTFLLRLDESNPAKLPVVVAFIMLFTLVYSPGAGCVPFLYSAEVWPNEGREIGMSLAVFCNFIGAAFLSLLVPRGLQWGASKLFGLFTGLSFLGFILVYLFVRPTNHGMSLDDMSRRFNDPSTLRYGLERFKKLIPPYSKENSRTSAVELFASANTGGNPDAGANAAAEDGGSREELNNGVGLAEADATVPVDWGLEETGPAELHVPENDEHTT